MMGGTFDNSPAPDWTTVQRKALLAMHNGDEGAARADHERRWHAKELAARAREEALNQLGDIAAERDQTVPELSAADLEKAVQELAKLPAAERVLKKKVVAKGFGITPGDLTALIKPYLPKAEESSDTGAQLFPELEPWPNPVNGPELLTRLAGMFSRYIALPPGAPDALALWVLHSHAIDNATISPILAVTSPTPECGKTTLLTLLGVLVRRPLGASNITAAALFRAVEKWTPTLLIDEADTFLRDNDELRGVINSGHSRANAFVIRTVGDDHEPTRFTTWAPKAIALIGKLPATIASRAIHIEMRRAMIADVIEELRGDRLGHLEPLARQAASWVAEHEAELRSAEPRMPAALYGRRADNWRHILAIAETAGGEWPAKARTAAEILSAVESGQTVSIVLLEDLHSLFDERQAQRLSSSEIVSALVEMDTRPWPEFQKGKPITGRGIARLLAACRT